MQSQSHTRQLDATSYGAWFKNDRLQCKGPSVDACSFNLFLVGGKSVTLSPRFILPLMFLVLLVSFSSLLFPFFSFLFLLSVFLFPLFSVLSAEDRWPAKGGMIHDEQQLGQARVEIINGN